MKNPPCLVQIPGTAVKRPRRRGSTGSPSECRARAPTRFGRWEMRRHGDKKVTNKMVV